MLLIAALLAAAAQPKPCPVVDMIPAWRAFEAKSGGLAPHVRAEAFVRDVAPAFPNYYRPLTDAAAREKLVKRAERFFAADQPSKPGAITPEQIAAGFAPAQVAFLKAFPDFRCDVDVDIGVSLGSFDGQAWRDDQGDDHLLFGVDQIARLHNVRSLPVLYTHELFHIYHAQQFRGSRWFADDSQPVWWGLWTEGLATWVSKQLNPGVSMADVLWLPRDLDAQVEPRRAEIARAMLADLDDLPEKSGGYERYFDAGKNDRGYPPRNGYYMGYLFAAHMAKGRTLAQLARLSPETIHREAKAWLEAEAKR